MNFLKIKQDPEEWIESYYKWMALPWLSMTVKLELFSSTDRLK